MKKYEHYVKDKAGQKKIPTNDQHEKADKHGQMLYLDISSLRNPKKKDPGDKTLFVAKPHVRWICDP